MRGSKYELKFDYQGKPINEDEIRQVLKKDAADTLLNGLGSAVDALVGSINTNS